MLIKRVITLMSAAIILIGCGAGVDERVDVSKVNNRSDSSIIASCAIQTANKTADAMLARSGPLEVVSIDILKDTPINEHLNVIDFKIQYYSEKIGKVIPSTITDFRCYSTAEAMEDEKARQKEQAIAEDALRHQQALEDARLKAKRNAEAAEIAALEAKRTAEIKLIEEQAAAEMKLREEQAAAELRFLKDKQAKVELEKLEAAKKEQAALEIKYAGAAETCIKNDAQRVKRALLSALHDIHRPGAVHVEDQRVSRIRFFKETMEVPYSFKLYTQIQYSNGLGEKGEPMALIDTQDIDVKSYSRSTAVAKCILQ